jgi:putative ABC transport system substrate-binding protein
MRRRAFIGLVGGAVAWPLAARAQPARKVPVIGFLSPGFPGITGPAMLITNLREGLSNIGYVEGESVKIEARWGLGQPETLSGYADELVRLKVDVLVANAPASVKAAKAATRDLPIVAVDLESDPVASGFVASLAAPGGNITGLFLDLPDLAGKWLQMVREVVPDARRIAVLWDVNTGEYQLRALSAVAKAMSVDLQVLEFRDSAGIVSVLSVGLKERPQALIQLGSPLINAGSKSIADFSATHRLPGISPFRAFAESGGVMSYGPNLRIMFSRGLPAYISKILKGSRPGTLPVEQPTNFEFVVNMKGSTAMGIKIPRTMLLRADEVIE